jgi:hypothetical protein
MKAALLFVVASVALCVASARAAGESDRRVGYEVGVWRWTDQRAELQGGPQRTYVASIGRWQRLSNAATWVTRLEYGDLSDMHFSGGNLYNRPGHWRDLGHSLTLETGLAVHPPVRVGLAPYLGASLGAGVARWGDQHEWGASYYQPVAQEVGSPVILITSHGRLAPAIVTSIEIGLRVFSKPGWPGVCAALGGRFAVGPHGGGFTTEPVLSIGY